MAKRNDLRRDSDTVQAGRIRLPSTDTLLVFERAAHNLNFKLTARELNMTPSAVSQQIAKLEASLGVDLFTRGSKGVRLTTIGAAYLKDVLKALALLKTATRHVVETANQQPIKIATYTPFSTYWLFPIVGELENLHPNLSLDVEAVTRLVDVSLRDADIFIEFGPLKRAAAEGHKVLFPRTSTPICSRAFLEKCGPLESPKDVFKVALLHNLATEEEWQEWLAPEFQASGPPMAQHRFRDRGSCLSAAAQGLGLALGCRNLLRHDIKTGSLVAPFKHTVVYDEGYYVRVAGAAGQQKKVDRLLNWLGSGGKHVVPWSPDKPDRNARI